MIILHSRRLIFVHISKCAGMWATRVLESNARQGDYVLSGPNGRFVGSAVRSRLHNKVRSVRRFLGLEDIYKHSSAMEICQKLPFVWDSYESIAIVRDPVSRVVSMLQYARQSKNTPANRKLAAAFSALKQVDDINAFILSDLFAELLSERFFKPQSEYILDRSGKKMVKHLLHIDKLEQQMQAFCDIPDTMRGKRENSSSQSIALTAESRKKLENLYSEDMALVERVSASWSQT